MWPRGPSSSAGILGQAAFRAHADGEDDQPAVDALAGFELRGNGPSRAASKPSMPSPRINSTPFSRSVFSSGRTISASSCGSTCGWSSITLTFLPMSMELLGHFQADEARADDGDVIHRGGGVLDAVHVLEIAQGEDERVVDARQRRTQRAGAGREDELVVGDHGLAAVCSESGRGLAFSARSIATASVSVRTSRLSRRAGFPASGARVPRGRGSRRRCDRAGRSWRTRRPARARAG